MYNPFPLLSPGLLKDQVAKGKRYFVRQSFARGDEPPVGVRTIGGVGHGHGNVKAVFLLRGYEGGEKEMVDRHMAALSKDGNAFLYDATLPEHLERLEMAARQPFGYKVFYAAKKGGDWKPPPLYAEKIRLYIFRFHPAWSLRRDGGKIEVGLYEEFGELFLKFDHTSDHGSEEEIIPFHIIETI